MKCQVDELMQLQCLVFLAPFHSDEMCHSTKRHIDKMTQCPFLFKHVEIKLPIFYPSDMFD